MWYEWTDNLTLLWLQGTDGASKRGYIQSTLNMTDQHMPINQAMGLGYVAVNSDQPYNKGVTLTSVGID